MSQSVLSLLQKQTQVKTKLNKLLTKGTSMKTKLFLMGLLSFSIIFGFSSCKDDDGVSPMEMFKKSLEEKFPNAENVEWKDNKGFKVAEFTYNGFEKDAWFNDKGVWVMTKTELKSIASTPEAVQKAHAAGPYADWKIDDVDLLERANPKAEFYVIEVENAEEEEVDLYYLADGTLYKEIIDNDDMNEFIPVIPEKISQFINQKYTNAAIKSIDTEYNYTLKKRVLEVDILHEKNEKEVQFTLDDKFDWIKTDWEIDWKDVPLAVQNAVKEEYQNWKIDDVDYSERPDGVYYVIELDNKSKEEVYVVYKADGSFVEKLDKYN